MICPIKRGYCSISTHPKRRFWVVASLLQESDDGQPLVEIDISDYKLEKVRAIQSHASQNPGLPGRPEEEMNKIPCSEFYTIARDGKSAENYPDWFETEREDTMLVLH